MYWDYQEADSSIPTQNLSRIYARYFRNTGRYLSPSPLLFTPFTATWSKSIPNHLR